MRERRGTSILILFGSIFNVQNNRKAQVQQPQVQTQAQPAQPVQAQPPAPTRPKPAIQPQLPLPTPPQAPPQQPVRQAPAPQQPNTLPPQGQPQIPPPIPPQQGIPNVYPPQRPPMGPPQMVPQPNMPPPLPYPSQQVPPGQMPAQAPQRQFTPQPDDPYLFPGRIPAYMQPTVPVTPEIPLEAEKVVEFKEEPAPMYAKDEVVEHDVFIEKVVEAPSIESSTVDLQSASVVEVEKERVIEFSEEIRYSVEEGNEPVVGSNEKESVWKPPDSED